MSIHFTKEEFTERKSKVIEELKKKELDEDYLPEIIDPEEIKVASDQSREDDWEQIYQKFKIKQIAGLIARRILSYMEVGKSVEQGDRLGFIRFGSRVDIVVPYNFKIDV